MVLEEGVFGYLIVRERPGVNPFQSLCKALHFSSCEDLACWKCGYDLGGGQQGDKWVTFQCRQAFSCDCEVSWHRLKSRDQKTWEEKKQFHNDCWVQQEMVKTSTTQKEGKQVGDGKHKGKCWESVGSILKSAKTYADRHGRADR